MAIFHYHYGIPAGFRQNEFVLRFFSTMVAILSKLIGGRRLTQMDEGRLLQKVFSNLLNMNGVIISRHFSDLVFENPKKTVFIDGCDGGEIITLIMLEKVSATGRELV